jgi:hypothetical protein
MATASIHTKATTDGVAQLKKTESRVRQLSLFGRIAWCVGAVLIAFSLFAMIDWFLILRSQPARWANTVFFAGTIVVGVLMAARFIRTITGTRNVASQLDSTSDAKAERWQTLATANSEATSQAMLNNVATQAIELQTNQLSGAPRWSVAIPLTILTLGIFGTAATAITSGSSFPTLVQRIAMPWQSIKLTQISAASGDQMIVRGEAVELDMQATGRIPSGALLQLETAGGIVTDIPVAADNGTFGTRFDRMEESVRYRWVAGDSQTQWSSVAVVDYPRIVDANLNIYDPDYTNRPPTQWQRLPRRLEALAGSQLIMDLKVDQPLKIAAAMFAPRGNDQDMIQLALVSNEGRWQLATELQQAGTLELQFAGSTGLESNESLRIEIVEDELPSVGILSSTDDIALTKEDQLQIGFTASDDFGVQSVQLVTTVIDAEGNSREVRQPFEMENAEDQRSVVGSFQLDLKELDLQKGSKVSYRVEASDRSGKTGSSGQMANSEMSPNDVEANEQLAANDNGQPEAPAANNPDPSSQQSPDLAEEMFNQAMQNAVAQAGLPSFTDQQLSRLENIEQMLRDAALASEAAASNAKGQSDQDDQGGTQVASSEQMLANAAKEFEEMQQQILDAVTKRQLKQWENQLGTVSDSGKAMPKQREAAANSLADALREVVGICKACGMQPKPQYAGKKRLNDFNRPCTCSKPRDVFIDEFEDVFSTVDQDAQVDSLLVLPYLEQLRKSAKSAKASLEIAIDDYTVSGYSETSEREVNRSSRAIVDAQRGIEQLVERSTGTPYAFVGLQCQALNEQGFVPAATQIETARQLATAQTEKAVADETDEDGGSKDQSGVDVSQDDDGKPTIEQAKDHLEFVPSLKRSQQRLEYVLNQIDVAVFNVKSRESLAKVETAVREFQKIEKAFTVLEKAMPNWLESPASTFYTTEAMITGIDKEFAEAYQQYLDDKAAAYRELAEVMKESPELRAKFLSQQMAQNTLIRDRLTMLSAEQSNLAKLLTASVAVTADRLPKIWSKWLQTIKDEARKAAIETDDKMRVWMPNVFSEETRLEMTRLTSQLLMSTEQMRAEPNWKNLRPVIERSLATVSQIENEVNQSSGSVTWKLNRVNNLESLKDQFGLLLDVISGLETDDVYAALQAGQIRIAAETASLLRRAEAGMSKLPQSDKTDKMRKEFFDWMEKEVGTPQFTATKRLQRKFDLTAVPLMQRAADGLGRSVARLDDVVTLLMDNFRDVQFKPGSVPPSAKSLKQLMAMVNQESSCGLTLGCKTCKQAPELNVTKQWDKLKRNASKSSSSQKKSAASELSQSSAQIAAMRAVNEYRKRSIQAQLMANAASEAIARNQALAPFVLQELNRDAAKQTATDDWNQIPSELRQSILSGGVKQVPEEYRDRVENYFRILAIQQKQ